MKNKKIHILFVILLGSVLFLPGLGIIHLFDWDEINFAESAREMLLTQDYLRVKINYEPFWEKPPLFFWLQAISMNLIGVNEYAARLPNAVVGIITLVVIFNIGLSLKKNFTFAWFWVLAYVGSFLPHFYFKSGIIDPLFNLFIFSSIYFLYKFYIDKKNRSIIIAGLLSGLSVLTKGPVGLLIPSLTFGIIVLLNKDICLKTVFGFFLFFLFSSLIAASWFAVETFQHGTWFIERFIEYNIRLFKTEDSGHGQPFYYHPLVLLIGCFPTSIWAIKNIVKKYDYKLDFEGWMQILFWIVLILFSLVKTKIIHYSSLCYFPITYLASVQVLDWVSGRDSKKGFQPYFVLVLGVIIGIVFLIFPILILNKHHWVHLIKDSFARENILLPIEWSGIEGIGGLVLILGAVYYFINRAKGIKPGMILLSSVCVCFQIALYWIAPKVERHVQGSYIDFLKEKSVEDCYIKAVGFKSYAQYYYSKRKPNYDLNMDNEQKLLYEKTNKPVYFITKTDSNHYHYLPYVRYIGERGGWVFFKKEVKN